MLSVSDPSSRKHCVFCPEAGKAIRFADAAVKVKTLVRQDRFMLVLRLTPLRDL
jgi:hypothetical protein